MIHNGKKTRKISIRFKLMLPVTAIMLIIAAVNPFFYLRRIIIACNDSYYLVITVKNRRI